MASPVQPSLALLRHLAPRLPKLQPDRLAGLIWLVPPLLALLPHMQTLPIWLTLACLGFWLWRWLLALTDRPLPHRFIRVGLALLALLAVFMQFGTLIGQQGGVPLFITLLFIKLLESETLAEKRLLLILTQFMGMSYFLIGQSLPVTVYLLAVAIFSIAAMAHLQAGGGLNVVNALRQSLYLFGLGLPLAMLLFVFFPRLSHPLWSLPNPAAVAKTGLSDRMQPGDIANLIQSSDIAFRAVIRLADEIQSGAQIAPQIAPQIDPNGLYWRGPTLADFDGRTWHALPENAPFNGQIMPAGTPLQVTLTLEPHQRTWLFSPGLPAPLPDKTRLTQGLLWQNNQAVTQRQRWIFTSHPEYRHFSEPGERAQALLLPEEFNPRARDMAARWRAENLTPTDIVQRALGLYRTSFSYTLQPPRLGIHSVDDFLFSTQRGFCEHFSSSFVFLMRAAGIPARVVTGYLGGELNPLDGHIVVRQSDAHAWAEVWLDDAQGWVRIDPTASVSPSRIESGIGAALPTSELPPALARLSMPWLQDLRHGWEMLNNGWNQWVLGYNQAQQLKLLARLTPSLGSLQGLATATIASVLIGLSILAWLFWRGRGESKPDEAAILWRLLEKKLLRVGFSPQTGEPPHAYINRVGAQHTEWNNALQEMVRLYLTARYADQPHQLIALKRAVEEFDPHPFNARVE